MGVVENFVNAANEAVAPEKLNAGGFEFTKTPLRKSRVLRALEIFFGPEIVALKRLFGPAPRTVTLRGDACKHVLPKVAAAIITALYFDLQLARRTLGEVRRECNVELERRRRAERHRVAVERIWLDAEDKLRLVTNAHFALVRRVAGLYEAIKHGDDEHRAWLREALVLHFAGLPVPPRRKKGKKK